MKKIHILVLSSLAALATLVVSCQGGGITPNAPLADKNDTLSYAYGVGFAQGIDQYLQQLGIVQDTNMFKMTYHQSLGAETDSLKRAELAKKLPAKIDSLKKANIKNINAFVKGMQEGFGSTDKGETAYLTGQQVGRQLQMMTENTEKTLDGVTLNRSAIFSGMMHSIKKDKPQVENAMEILRAKDTEAREAQMRKQEEEMKKQEEEMKKNFTEKIEAEQKFMDENKSKPGIETLPSGLQYKIVKKGDGDKPKATDRVKVNYKGTLLDGKEFDSGKDVGFQVNQVIKGWTEALQLMPVGSKWIIYLPYDIAYGGRGAGENISPFSNLIFEIELLSIEK